MNSTLASIVLTLLFVVSSAASDSFAPLWQKNPPNTTDMVLIYQGGRQRPALSAEDFAPYVSCKDPRDHKQKWLFDGFLFIEYVNAKKHAFEEGLHLTPADKADWQDLLDRNFEPGHGLPALEQTIRETEHRIGKPLRPRQVVLTLPEPIEGATNWGQQLNFSNLTDRVTASTWYLDHALEKWQQLNPKHLKLAGFYFVPERTLGNNSQFLQKIAEVIHQRGYKFFWIPYWQARGAAQWKQHGFDIAWQQPNHFFHPELPDSRLQQACEFARKNDMGMEFEMDGRLISKPETFAPRFDAYLKAFENCGAKTNSSIAYYEGGGAVLQLARSKKPTLHKYYDRLAQWVLDRQSLADRFATEAFPHAASKKGLQVDMIDDAIALGVKHAALNFDLAQLIDPSGDTNNPCYQLNGKAYHFRRSYLEWTDQRIKSLSDHDILVYLIVLAYKSPNPDINRILHHPNAIENPPNGLAAFNTVTDEGRAWFQASLEFLAERWSRANQRYGRAVGYIIGNEVNSHSEWYNMGKVTMEQFADDYLRTVRIAHDAIRKQCSFARVYLSLEHHWNIHYPALTELQSFPAHPFLEYFARRAREGGDFDWNIAFHPYPENLFEPRFWNDKSATTNENTPRITFKNLEMLTKFMKQKQMLYHGLSRSIILSEQGFHTPDGPDGQKIQAAAFCYAYKKIEGLKGIDAFILHRHIDNANEGGLMLGLRGLAKDGDPYPKKLIYDCFRQADTPEWKQSFQFALPIIGLKNWNQILARPTTVAITPPKMK